MHYWQIEIGRTAEGVTFLGLANIPVSGFNISKTPNITILFKANRDPGQKSTTFPRL